MTALQIIGRLLATALMFTVFPALLAAAMALVVFYGLCSLAVEVEKVWMK